MNPVNPIKSFNEYMIPALITVVLLVLSVLLHLKWCGTQMVSPESMWLGNLQYHLDTYPFSIRYLIAYPLLFLNNYFSLPVRESFFVIQYTLAFMLGLAFYRFLRILEFNIRWSNIGVFLLIIAYPIFCAHFEPVHTFDDILAYLFILISFSYILMRKICLGAIFFLLSCFAREQSLIFFPIFLLVVIWFIKDKSFSKKLIYVFTPLVIYLIFYWIVWEPSNPERFQLIIYNFENFLRARDSIYSFFISFGFIWMASFVFLWRLLKTKKTQISNFIFWGTILSVPSTIALTFFLTLARETRIFFPPFIFLIPLALWELSFLNSALKNLLIEKRIILYSINAAVLLAIGFYLGFQIFPSFEFRNCTETSQYFAGFHFGVILIMMEIYLLKKLKIT